MSSAGPVAKGSFATSRKTVRSRRSAPTARGTQVRTSTIPALNVSPDTPVEELGITLYRLIPEELSGRRFGTTEDRLGDT